MSILAELKEVCPHCDKPLGLKETVLHDDVEGSGRFGYEVYCTGNCPMYVPWFRDLTNEEKKELEG